VSVGDTGFMFLAVTAGMFIGGPFHAYIIDAYRRRTVCVLSFIGTLLAIALYSVVETFPQLLALCVAQGVCAGLGITSGITLAIDITKTGLRSSGNLAYSWMIRLGMLLGVSLGVLLYQWYDFQLLQTVSIIIGAVGVFCIMQVYVPFRAPIVTRLCSFDRYFLPRGWIPAINLAIIAFIPGLIIPIYHNFSYGVSMGEWELPFYAFVALAFPLAIAFHHYLCNNRPIASIVSGLIMIIVSVFVVDICPACVSALLLGFGLGLVTPEFLMMFVRMSEHCQRCTANMTHFLAWETGLTAGIALSCRWNMMLQHTESMFYGRITAIAALVFFLLFTVPYFKKNSVEE
jgi:MFS family permease